MSYYELGGGYELGDMFVGDEEDLEMLLEGEDWGTVGLPTWARPRMARGGRGAVATRRVPMPMQQALAQRMVQQGSVVKEAAPTKSREYALPLDSVVTVAAGATVIITNRPQVLFRAERLVISGAIAAQFAINDFRVGKNSQFAAAGALPGDMFAPGSFGVRLKCDTAQISNDISVNITNLSGGALRFLAGVVGEAVE